VVKYELGASKNRGGVWEGGRLLVHVLCKTCPGIGEKNTGVEPILGAKEKGPERKALENDGSALKEEKKGGNLKRSIGRQYEATIGHYLKALWGGGENSTEFGEIEEKKQKK